MQVAKAGAGKAGTERVDGEAEEYQNKSPEQEVLVTLTENDHCSL